MGLFALVAFNNNPLDAATVNDDLVAERRPLYTTADDPALHVVSPGGQFDGVADLTLNRTDGTFGCSGALLGNGREVLTAAHCVTDNNGVMNTNSVATTFQLPSGTQTFNSQSILVHPDWNGNFDVGFDLALITLDTFVPDEVPRHDIYRGADEVGQIVSKAGYGRSGNGNDGDVINDGLKRSGLNRYDALGDVFSTVPGSSPTPGSQLAFDFDDGTTGHDAFGFFEAQLNGSGLGDLGLGDDEVMSAPGDSGGPTFINNQIAGVTSYGLRLSLRGGPPSSRGSDVDKELNSSFGEFGIDTRVSFFASWIDASLTPPPPPPLINGDLNADGVVGIEDLNLVLGAWDQVVTPMDLLAGDPPATAWSASRT